MIQSVECLSFAPQSQRADEILLAISGAAANANAHVFHRTEFRGGSDLLVVWGPGAPNRFGPMRQQLESGGHVACFDLAYWHRDSKVRVSIDAAHPQAWVMRRNLPFNRLVADQVTPEDRYDPAGPVIVAGLGEKARVQYGAAVIDAWEWATAQACMQQLHRPVIYRRKRNTSPAPSWAPLTSDGPIESVLPGASLLVTWHSNVAVDAIRMGIPVICHDGAAAAVCPSTISDPSALEPLGDDLRWAFLANLAWFQWAPAEATGCWRFLSDLLS